MTHNNEMTMGFGDQYLLVIKVYSRLFGLLYRDSHHNPRFNKVVAAIFQFSIILLLTGILTIVGEMALGATVIVTLVIVRFVQMVINFSFSNSSFRD